MGVLVRRHPVGAVTAAGQHDQELFLQRRARKWLVTTAITWPVWALTGAPTWLPHVVANHHHVVASLGIWPAFLMVGGLADIARMARRIYVEPIERSEATDSL